MYRAAGGNHELRADNDECSIRHPSAAGTSASVNGLPFSVLLPSSSSCWTEMMARFGVELQRLLSTTTRLSTIRVLVDDMTLAAIIRPSKVTKAVLNRSADWITTIPLFFPCCIAAGCSPARQNLKLLIFLKMKEALLFYYLIKQKKGEVRLCQ